VTSRIGYYSDDDDFDDDEDPNELRERAFTLWRKHGARCNTRTLRLAHEYADDLGFYADGRAIHSASSRGAARDRHSSAGPRRRDARTRRHCAGSATVRRGSASPSADWPRHEGEPLPRASAFAWHEHPHRRPASVA
jgi:hypothetical protein